MMITKGGSVVGSLWRFFVATFQSGPVQNGCPILMLVLTASKVCNHFRHSLPRPTHHVRNDRHCSHHDHSRYMLRCKPTLIAESPSPTLDLIVAIFDM